MLPTWRIPVLLFLGIYLFSGLSPIATSYDSRWTVYTVMSLWERGDTNLDEFEPSIPESEYYSVECVEADGTVRRADGQHCDGYLYSRFPIGVPVITAPLILTEVGTLRLAAPFLGGVHPASSVIAGFLRADYSAAHALIEMQAASVLLAATAVILYWIARRYLPWGRAATLAVLFGIATSAYSSAGRALWSHTPSMLLLTITIYLLLAAEERPSLAGWAGLPVALSYTVRPTDALFVVIFTTYVAAKHRTQLWRYFAAAAPVAVAFFAYMLPVYHGHLSPYYNSTLPGFEPANWGRMAGALAGNLVSPGRGLFIYTPVFVFAAWSMIRQNWKTPLSPWLAVLAAAHWVAVSAYVDNWWAGHSYGARFFTDLTPVFVLFLIPYLARWQALSVAARTGFVVLALFGLGIHLRGGWSTEVYRWNTEPANVDEHPERNWDWRDPPFLRGLGNGTNAAPERRPH